MRSRIIFFWLLAIVACKDGGKLPDPLQNGNLIWSFNNSVATQFARLGQAPTSFSSSIGLVFSVSQQPTTSCAIPFYDVKINDVSTNFESVRCYIVNVSDYDRQEYFIMNAIRRSGDLLYSLSYGFPGAKPENKTYPIDPRFIVGGYSIYRLTSTGGYESIEFYVPRTGSASLITIGDVVNVNSKMGMSEFRSAKTLLVDAKLSCCAPR